LGQTELDRLKTAELIIDVAPTENEEAFWSAEDQIHANAIKVEAAFDAFMTPFFNDMVLALGMVFVNSENYRWLPQSPLVVTDTDLKPDGFATHRGMFRIKDNGVQRPEGFRFGVPEKGLFDCVILFECKLKITADSFGQVVRYLQHLSPTAAAILFDRDSFWLINSHKGVVFKLQKAKWVNQGSKSLLRKFITANMSPWVTHLTNACSALGVDVVEGGSFLGRGAHGRVFKVTDQDGVVLALKIVVNDSIERLYREQGALAKAQHTGLTIRPLGSVTEIPNCAAALLLSPVGEPLPRPTTREDVLNLFGLLWELHANGLVHGDPRVPNVIFDGQKFLWIDLVDVMEASPTLKQLDAEILTRSILSVSRTVLLDPALKQLVDNYGKSATQENLNHLAQVVCQSLAFSN